MVIVLCLYHSNLTATLLFVMWRMVKISFVCTPSQVYYGAVLMVG